MCDLVCGLLWVGCEWYASVCEELEVWILVYDEPW